MKGSMVRPLLMLIFVVFMVFLMQKEVEDKEELQKQQTEIDPGSVIYSDIGASEGELIDMDGVRTAEGDNVEDPIEIIPEKEKEGVMTLERETMEK